jgi:transposase-like protein
MNALTDAAQRHRPYDLPSLLSAAVTLRQNGLKPRDIGQVLGINEAVVSQLLGNVEVTLQAGPT